MSTRSRSSTTPSTSPRFRTRGGWFGIAGCGTGTRKAIRRIEALDDSDGIAEWAGDDYFGLILVAYLDLGRATRGLVGGATSELIHAADLVAFATDWMEANLA